MTISGGEVLGSLVAYNNSRLSISDGIISKLMVPNDDATVDVSGGGLYAMEALGQSVISISGGTFSDHVWARNSSTLNMTGGAASKLRAYENSTITIHGYDFRTTGGLVLDGESVLGTGVLTGKWMDGTAWVMSIETNQAGATILAVPEPGTLALLGLGGLAAIRRRRK